MLPTYHISWCTLTNIPHFMMSNCIYSSFRKALLHVSKYFTIHGAFLQCIATNISHFMMYLASHIFYISWSTTACISYFIIHFHQCLTWCTTTNIFCVMMQFCNAMLPTYHISWYTLTNIRHFMMYSHKYPHFLMSNCIYSSFCKTLLLVSESILQFMVHFCNA